MPYTQYVNQGVSLN